MRIIHPILGAVLMMVAACSSGGADSETSTAGSDAANFGCDGSCSHHSLSIKDVSTIIGRAVAASERLGQAGTVAVVDRVGNVLGVYQMEAARAVTIIDGQIGAVGGLEGAAVPASLAAISKAGTGAYLSSQGNAFSTRTASQIIQENFNPGEHNQPGGPLFGVQFSQLFCSDVTIRNLDVASNLNSGAKFKAAGLLGPRPLPLGLSADPGGLPLYIEGDLVGGLGVEIDGTYRLDRDISNFDDDIEERVALTASFGFEAPSERVAPNVFIGGKSFRYSDLTYSDVEDPGVADLDNSRIVAIPEYGSAAIRAGAAFGTFESGIIETSRAGMSSGLLVNADGTARYPTKAGAPLPGGAELSAPEVEAILDSALLTAGRTRAAIRRPLDTSARVSIFVIDHLGNPLGFTRSPDAPIFGIDVALQKARTATFFSSTDFFEKLNLIRSRNRVGEFSDWGQSFSSFVGASAGQVAFAARSIGNLSRPFFIDGINGNLSGPLSLPFPGSQAGRSWSPFNTGLQLDITFERLLSPLGVPNLPATLPDSCVDRSVLGNRLANGIQIFPGAVPLYRGNTLVGGIGVSGDGIDHDDFVSFYGASRPGLDFAGHPDIGDQELGFNAPLSMRADNLSLAISEARLRYVNCPESAFIGSEEQNVCAGL